jgi:hypothetical protein
MGENVSNLVTLLLEYFIFRREITAFQKADYNAGVEFVNTEVVGLCSGANPTT